MLAALVLAACGEPPQSDLYTARRNIERYEISPVTFRSIDRFFPVAPVRRGGPVSELERAPAAERLSLELPVDIGEGPVPLAAALRETDTNAFLVMQDGIIVLEEYFNGATPGSRFIGWSISKSIVSLLVGIALAEGALDDIDDPVEKYWPQVAATPFAGVPIRSMLEMRAGVDYTEWIRFGRADVDLLAEQSLFTNRRRFTDVSALELTSAHPPGEAFNYSSLTSSVLARVLEEATGTSLAEYTERKLWVPAGMELDAFWMLDGEPPDGQAFGGGGINAAIRDYARIGQMVLDNGAIGGVQVVPAEWIAVSTRYDGEEPVMPRTPRGYGYQWWTFLGTSIVEAVGIHGQFISIDPETRTVIVKASYWPGRGGGERQNMLLFEAIRTALR